MNLSADDMAIADALDRIGFRQQSSIQVQPFDDKAVFAIDTGFGISFAHRMTAEQLDIFIAQMVDVYSHIAPDGTAGSDRLEQRDQGFYFCMVKNCRVLPTCHGRDFDLRNDPLLLERLFDSEADATEQAEKLAARNGCDYKVFSRAL